MSVSNEEVLREMQKNTKLLEEILNLLKEVIRSGGALS